MSTKVHDLDAERARKAALAAERAEASRHAAIVNVRRVVDSVPDCTRCRGKVVVQRDGSPRCAWCGYPGADTRPESERKR